MWYDRRFTVRDSKFNQITAGLEWFGEDFDIKLNSYFPLNNTKTHTDQNDNGTNGHFNSNNIIINTDQVVLEEALKGVDIEFGFPIPLLEQPTDLTRIYVGGYAFHANKANNIAGWRARLMSDITSDIQLGARLQRDNERGFNSGIEMTFRFPFGNKQQYKEKGLYARLDESPERDIDIVSNDIVISDGLNQILLNANTGLAQNVLHVDADAAGGGTGTLNDPFNNLTDAENAANAHDMIYIHPSSIALTGGIELTKEGQMLIGSGSDLRFSKGRFQTSNGRDLSASLNILTSNVNAPVITNAGGHGVLVEANKVEVSGITVNNASQRGIYVINDDNITWDYTYIHDVTVSNNGNDGLRVYLSGINSSIETVAIDNISSSKNDNHGTFTLVQNNASIGRAQFNNLAIDNNLSNGFYTLVNSNAILENLSVDNLVSYKNANHGVFVLAQTDAQLQEMSFNNIDTYNNTSNGFYINSSSDAHIEDVFLNELHSHNNDNYGLFVLAGSGGTINNSSIQSSYIYENDNHGFYVNAGNANTQINNMSINDLNTYDNNGHGVFVLANNDGSVSVSFENSTIYNNIDDGFNLNDDTLGTFIVDLGGGTLKSIGYNQIYNNGNYDLNLDLDGETLKAENNWWGQTIGLESNNIDPASDPVDSTPFLVISD